jgi:hypothetical protein
MSPRDAHSGEPQPTHGAAGKRPYEKPAIKFEGHVEALAASCTGRTNKQVGQAMCRIQGAFS